MNFTKHIIVSAMLCISTTMLAQNLNSAYFTNDYKYRHSMNPAFGNEQNYISVPGLGNINVSTQGNFGYEDVVMNNPMYPSNSEHKMTTFMNPYISVGDALEGFNSGNNRIIGDVGIAILSAGFKGFGGYNTIELNAKASFGTSLPYELFEFAKNTGNKSYDIGDIYAGAQSYAELAFGHSRQLNKNLRIGAKVKFLFGIARADFQFEDVKADLSSDDKWTLSGRAKAEMSMKGFTYLSEEKEYKEEGRGTYQRVNDIDINGSGIGGFGMALDLGAIYKINDYWTISAALMDLGFISWSNTMTAVNRGESFEFGGFHDINVKEERGETIKGESHKYVDQLTDFVNLQDEGDKGSRTTGIGATMNFGCEYTLPCYKKLSFGLLSSTRLRGNYSWTEGRLSANWVPTKWLDGGVNFAVNSFTTSMGWVINIHPKAYNFFIGMDHILGKMSKEAIPLSSNASIAVGMNITW